MLASAGPSSSSLSPVFFCALRCSGPGNLRVLRHPCRQLLAAGSDPKTSVLDPQGECWEVAGLYCCDGSTFPTPTGKTTPTCPAPSLCSCLNTNVSCSSTERPPPTTTCACLRTVADTSVQGGAGTHECLWGLTPEAVRKLCVCRPEPNDHHRVHLLHAGGGHRGASSGIPEEEGEVEGAWPRAGGSCRPRAWSSPDVRVGVAGPVVGTCYGRAWAGWAGCTSGEPVMQGDGEGRWWGVMLQ